MSPTINTLAHLYTSLNQMDLSPMPSLTYLERTILTASDNKDMFREKFSTEVQSPLSTTHSRELSQDSKRRTYISLTSGNKFQMSPQAGPKDCHFFETRIVYTGRKIPIQIPLTVTPDVVGDVPSSLGVDIVLSHTTRQLFLGATSQGSTAVHVTSTSNNLRAFDAPNYHLIECSPDRETDRIYWVRSSFWGSSTFRSRCMCNRKRRKRYAPRILRTRLSLYRSK
jgi:hypothetical protein